MGKIEKARFDICDGEPHVNVPRTVLLFKLSLFFSFREYATNGNYNNPSEASVRNCERGFENGISKKSIKKRFSQETTTTATYFISFFVTLFFCWPLSKISPPTLEDIWTSTQQEAKSGSQWGFTWIFSFSLLFFFILYPFFLSTKTPSFCYCICKCFFPFLHPFSS